jgi:hypothetical protein
VVAMVQEKSRADETKIAQLSNRTPVAPVRTGADGGMHPVFVAAVKRNEVGVSPSTAAYSTASIPGTIPPTVRPPRIPELAQSPLVTGDPIAPPPGNSHSLSNEAPMLAAHGATPEPVRVASTEPMVPASTPSESKSNFFGNLFASKSDKTEKKDEPGFMDKMARTMGLRGSEPKTAAVTPAPPPAPKPRVAVAKPAAAKPAPAANGAIRPKPVEGPKTVGQQPASQQPAASVPSAPAQQQAASAGAIAGAAPVVPAGSFDNRWSAFR